jgi:hypothetical protein
MSGDPLRGRILEEEADRPVEGIPSAGGMGFSSLPLEVVQTKRICSCVLAAAINRFMRHGPIVPGFGRRVILQKVHLQLQ